MLMVTAPLPLRFRPPPDPPPCKFLLLGSLFLIEPPEPPDPPDGPVLLRFFITSSIICPDGPAPDGPASILYSVIESLLPITPFYSVIECSLSNSSWFQICLTSSRVKYLMLNCRLAAWLWFQVLIIITLLKPTSTSLLPWLLNRCCSCVARSAVGLEDYSPDALLSVLFKGSASWCHITSATIATVKIVIHALVAVLITSIRALIVFSVSHGVIPLLKPGVVEIRGRLCNISCLGIMIAFISVFLLAFCCIKIVSQYGFIIIFVNSFSYNGD